MRTTTGAQGVRIAVRAAAILTLLGALWSSPAAHAGQNDLFGVAPHPARFEGVHRRSFGIPMDVGRTFRDAVRIDNRTDRPLELAVYAADASAGRDGLIAIGFRGRRPAGLAADVSVERSLVTIGPRGHILVGFDITVGEADPVPSMGAIVVESVPQGSRAGVDLVQRIAILLKQAPAGASTGTRPVPDGGLPFWWLLAIPVAAAAGRWLAGRRRRTEWPAEPEPVPIEISSPEPVAVAAPAASRPKPRQRRPAQPRPPKRNYIPLDEL